MTEAVTARLSLHQSRCNNTTEVLRLHYTYVPRDAYSVIVRVVVRPVERAEGCCGDCSKDLIK